jgi:LacI family transcriptional regulator
MAATLAQIAALANTHMSTVSLVLNGRQLHRVSPETRERIEKIAAELDYRANRHAQGLAHGKTRTVALLLNQLTNPFFGQYVSLLESRFDTTGYHVSPFEIRSDPDREHQLMSLYNQGVCDIIVSLAHYSAKFDAELLKRPVIVLINDYTGVASEKCPLSHVAVDYRSAMIALMQHLEASRYRRLGLILHGNNAPFPKRKRESRYAETLRDLVTTSSIICTEDQQITAREHEPLKDWYDATIALLTRDPQIDVLLVHSMDQVVPVIEAAKTVGRIVGQDLGLVTFDDPPTAEWLQGGITVIREPTTQVADALADLTMGRLNGVTKKRHFTVQAELITRASTQH